MGPQFLLDTHIMGERQEDAVYRLNYLRHWWSTTLFSASREISTKIVCFFSCWFAGITTNIHSQ